MQPSPSETLAERCKRLALHVEDYERDMLGRMTLELTAIRTTLEEAAQALHQPIGTATMTAEQWEKTTGVTSSAPEVGAGIGEDVE